jgi:hypothetical protein
LTSTCSAKRACRERARSRAGQAGRGERQRAGLIDVAGGGDGERPRARRQLEIEGTGGVRRRPRGFRSDLGRRDRSAGEGVDDPAVQGDGVVCGEDGRTRKQHPKSEPTHPHHLLDTPIDGSCYCPLPPLTRRYRSADRGISLKSKPVNCARRRSSRSATIQPRASQRDDRPPQRPRRGGTPIAIQGSARGRPRASDNDAR